MNNNPYYVLSSTYKTDQKKNTKKDNIKKKKKCKQCLEQVPDNHFGKFHGYNGWCKECAEIDYNFVLWFEACFDELEKPKSEQKQSVFSGQSVSYVTF